MKTIRPVRSPVPPLSPVSEEDIRDYAYHLYLQSGCVAGRELDNWLEAEACLRSQIPIERSHLRLHRHLNGEASTGPQTHAAA
jgi:hypothetical protein